MKNIILFSVMIALSLFSNAQAQWIPLEEHEPFWFPYIPPTTPAEPETSLSIGLAPRTPDGDVVGLKTNTVKLDARLRSLQPYVTISDHFTRDLANEGFSELSDAKSDIENAIREALLSISGSVRVRSVSQVSVGAKPLTIEFSQKSTEIGLFVGGFTADIQARVRVPVCGTFNVKIELDNINVETMYDIFTGRVNDSQANWNLKKLDLDGNILQSLCKEFGEIIEGANVKSLLNNEIENGLESPISLANSQSFFSIMDWVDGVEDYIIRYGQLEGVPQSIANHALNALNIGRNFIENPNFGGSGVTFGMQLEASPSQDITLLASHAPVLVTDFSRADKNVIVRSPTGRPWFVLQSMTASVQLDKKSDTERVDAYVYVPANSLWFKHSSLLKAGWNKVGSTTGSNLTLRDLPGDSTLAFIARNKNLGDLYSRPVIQETKRCLPLRTCIARGIPNYQPAYVQY